MQQVFESILGASIVGSLVTTTATKICAVSAATLALLTAASPHWLPDQPLPPSAEWADAIGRAVETTLEWLLTLATWLGGSALPTVPF